MVDTYHWMCGIAAMHHTSCQHWFKEDIYAWKGDHSLATLFPPANFLYKVLLNWGSYLYVEHQPLLFVAMTISQPAVYKPCSHALCNRHVDCRSMKKTSLNCSCRPDKPIFILNTFHGVWDLTGLCASKCIVCSISPLCLLSSQITHPGAHSFDIKGQPA